MARLATEPRPLIAVVDDDVEVLDSLADALDAAGFDVLVARNGLRLVSALSAAAPAAIVLDVVMSWMDGFELCRALKQNPQFADIPILFISGRSGESDVRRGYEVGGVDYFAKPLELRQLIARIQELVQPARADD